MRWRRKQAGRPSGRVTFTPPEGVPISFDLASRGARLGAQLLDLLLTWTAAIAFVLLVIWANVVSWNAFVMLVTLLVFLLRVPYYILSELVWNGRTPGKRIVRIRVISADGQRLTPWQITARNLMKEVEFFTPFTLMMAASSDSLGGWGLAIMWVWVGTVFVVFLANRNRQRLGDMIAGTLVVDSPKVMLLPDLAATTPPQAVERFTFLPHHLDHYGRLELQTLEDILRSPASGPQAWEELGKVTDAILRKIGYTDPVLPGDRREFLLAFYRAQREHLESRRLFGDRREDKFHANGKGA